MGSRGSFLRTGGFTSMEWKTVGKIMGVKILRKKSAKKNVKGNLPFYSNTPGTAYILLDIDEKFSQYRQYNEDRTPAFDIDYGRHDSKKPYLHMHVYEGGRRLAPIPITNEEGDIINENLYEKYKGLLKGIKL